MKYNIYIGALLSGCIVFSCNSQQRTGEPARIFYVNSYHPGYGSSDDVMQGIEETLEGNNVELETFFLDTKRKSTAEEAEASARRALADIERFKPDVLIVSDDNAVKDLVVPHFNRTGLPVVFCGVNWSAAHYNLGENVTGMLEVLPLRELLSEIISSYPGAKKLVVLSENSLSEQNNTAMLDTLYRNLGLEPEYLLTNDFGLWKAFFLEAGRTADLIYIPTNGAIKNWDNGEAGKLVEMNLEIPVVTCDDFMMPYAVFGVTKVAKEQGEWAAEAALKIINGKKPAEIPVIRNRQTRAFMNSELAAKIDFRLSDEMKTKIIDYKSIQQ